MLSLKQKRLFDFLSPNTALQDTGMLGDSDGFCIREWPPCLHVSHL